MMIMSKDRASGKMKSPERGFFLELKRCARYTVRGKEVGVAQLVRAQHS